MENRQSSIVNRQSSIPPSNQLAVVLGVIFVLAVVMGAGPGIYLINPDPANAGPTPTFLGMPVVYAWTVFWTFVQGAVILVAYFCLWNTAEADGESQSKAESGESSI